MSVRSCCFLDENNLLMITVISADEDKDMTRDMNETVRLC